MEYNVPEITSLSVSEPSENYALGYIKIFRSLKKHWIWQDEKKLKWWLDILLTVNYTDKKVLIRGILVDCKRGQSVQSLDTWAQSWRTTKKTVQTFFKLLASDGMLVTESLQFTTRITVCNFDSYNGLVNGQETTTTTQSKRSLPPNNKGNKDNKVITNEDIGASHPKKTDEYTPEQHTQYKNFLAWIEKNTPEINKLPKPITLNQFLIISGQRKNTAGQYMAISGLEIKEILEKIENNKVYLKKYRSPYLCITHWTKNNRTKQNV